MTDIEQRVFRASTGTGAADQIVGIGILVFGVAVAFDSTVFAVIGPMLVVTFVRLFQRRLIESRLGRVKLSKPRRLLLDLGGKLLLLLLAFAALAAMLMIDTSALHGTLHRNFLLVFGAVFLLVMLVVAWLRWDRWFVIYAVIAAAAFTAGNFLRLHLAVPMITLGGVMTVVGTVRLVQALRSSTPVEIEP